MIRTYTGKMVDLTNLQIEDINPLDIAHSLSFQNRYLGHTKFMFSVAQHSVLLYKYCKNTFQSRSIKLWALLHDASETYIGDIPSPIKENLFYHLSTNEWISIYDLEKTIQKKIRDRFEIDITTEGLKVVEEMDKRILADEYPILMGPTLEIQPLGIPITPWPSDRAEELFLMALREEKLL